VVSDFGVPVLLPGWKFSQTPTYWINLQTSYDLKTAQKAMVQWVQHVQPLLMTA